MRLPNFAIWPLTALLFITVLAGCGGQSSAPAQSPIVSPNLVFDANASGKAATFAQSGFVDTENPFFQPFGNGRRCSSCHIQSDGWSITPATAQAKFNASDGKDALFLPLDAANSPLADVSTVDARRAAYSLLLNKGLIRMHAALPNDAEFTLDRADDPYAYASASDMSLFRRTLPAANLKFQTTIMWDGSQTYKDPSSALCIAGTSDCYATLAFNLGKQINEAIQDHAQLVAGLTPAQVQQILDFETGLFTAQAYDNAAQSLLGASGAGGPYALSQQSFYFGIDDLLAGDYQTKSPFNAVTMTPYSAWTAADANLIDPDTPAAQAAAVSAARASIARGQVLFNTRRFAITGVSGLNDALHLTTMQGTCSSCHDAPNAGTHSTPLLLNTGISDAARRTPDLPLYTLKNKQTGDVVQTTDPGAALRSGKWSDIGKFKVPALRGLAAHAPYFHNGSAKDLGEVVDFYNSRFAIGLTDQERQDLIAFLKAL